MNQKEKVNLLLANLSIPTNSKSISFKYSTAYKCTNFAHMSYRLDVHVSFDKPRHFRMIGILRPEIVALWVTKKL